MRARWAAAVLVALSASPARLAQAEARPLPVAAADGHAWFVVDRTSAAGTERVLLHHADSMGCDCMREALVLPAVPEAMSAQGADLWIVMPAGDAGRRDVLRVSSSRNPATGAWFPAGPPAVMPSLPGDGELLGIAPVDDGLLALRSGTGLERLVAGRWQPLEGAPSTAGRRLRSIGGRPALVDAAGGMVAQGAGGAWSAVDVAPAGPGTIDFVPGAARPTVVVRLPGGARSVRVLVRGAALERGAFDPPDRASGLVGLGDNLALVVPTGEGGAAFRWLDPVTGALGPVSVLAPQPADATQWVCLPSVAMLVLGLGAFVGMRRASRLKSGSADRR